MEAVAAQQLTPAASADTGTFNAAAFDALFLDPTANKDRIWKALAHLITQAAKGIRANAHDLSEYKAETLVHVAALIAASPPPRNPTAYFRRCIHNKLRRLASSRRPAQIEFAGEISLHDLYEIDSSALATEARDSNPMNWHSYRLHTRRDRYLTEKLFRSYVARATAILRASDSKAERAVARVVIEAIQNASLSLLGKRIPAFARMQTPPPARECVPAGSAA